MLRYPEWDAVPIWVPGFFGIYSGMLYWAGFRILQYLQWNVILSWFPNSSIFTIERYTDLISEFFNIYILTWFPNSSIFTVERYTDLISKLFNIYNESLFQSFFWSLRYLRWDATPIQLHSHNPRTGRPASASVPCPDFMFSLPVGSVSQRERISVRAVAEEGWYNLGCGRGRYCGRVSCLSQRRVLALPQWF